MKVSTVFDKYAALLLLVVLIAFVGVCVLPQLLGKSGSYVTPQAEKQMEAERQQRLFRLYHNDQRR